MTTKAKKTKVENETEGFREWAIVELMGHRKLAGWVHEVQIAGHGFLRLDVPSDPPATQIIAPSSVYAITPTTEKIARAFATRNRPEPVTRWELPAPAPAKVHDDEDEDALDRSDDPDELGS